MSPLLLTLSRLRAPIIFLIVVFAIGMTGLVLIPGVDENGGPWHMTLFQAFYFMTYTASTIGFGEVPHPFTDRQRLWVTLVIYLSVIGWAYLVASLLSLARDKAVRKALAEARLRRRMANLVEPFYVICGVGETGRLVARALDLRGRRFVAVEIDETRAQEIDLMEFRQEPLVLKGDARLPDNLVAAGLRKDNCRGVLALTNDDRVNLAVAMTARLLEPNVPVLARAMRRETAANMASFDTRHVINPFARFGERLALAIAAPANYRLVAWLTGLPGSGLPDEAAPPHGRWVVCGYGRFGREVVRAFADHRLEVTIIDPSPAADAPPSVIRGTGTEADSLLGAGIRDAVGVVAGSDDDVDNLSTVVTARELNPKLFTIVRQNLKANQQLFDAFDADMKMVSSELIASECLAVLRAPQLGRFLQVAWSEDSDWAHALVNRLVAVAGTQVPSVWSVTLNISEAPAFYRHLLACGDSTVADLCRNPTDRSRSLDCIVLMIDRSGQILVLPGDEEPLRAGDQVLFAGRAGTRHRQRALLREPNVRDYVLGRHPATSGARA